MPTGTQSPEKFAKHLDGVAWPARKQDLLEKARSSDAPPEILDALAKIPGENFQDRDEVLVAYEAQFGDVSR